MAFTIEGIESSFDNDHAEELLSLSLSSVLRAPDLVRKSLYDFDLETPEGIEKLMALLPIMDAEILQNIMTELWPNYPSEQNPQRHRMEIRGYLKDYLKSYESGQLEENEAALDAPRLDAADTSEEQGSPDEAAVAPDPES